MIWIHSSPEEKWPVKDKSSEFLFVKCACPSPHLLMVGGHSQELYRTVPVSCICGTGQHAGERVYLICQPWYHRDGHPDVGVVFFWFSLRKKPHKHSSTSILLPLCHNQFFHVEHVELHQVDQTWPLPKCRCKLCSYDSERDRLSKEAEMVPQYTHFEQVYL